MIETGPYEHRLLFEPAYDCRVECLHETKGKHGQHGVEMRFVVLGTDSEGRRAATQFLLFTGWMLADTTEQADYSLGATLRRTKSSFRETMPADLGYHSPAPRWENQGAMPCDLLGVCYYDGSTLNAERPFRTLVAEGEGALWRELESYFEELFG